jgi:predicted dehydrogenase
LRISKLIKNLRITKNFSVIDSLDVIEPERILIAFIVNKAINHYETAKNLIHKKINILVEKPMTLHLRDSQRLINLASTQNVMLLYSNVLLYSSTLTNFVNIIAGLGPITSIAITWHDAINEIRYDEVKEVDYDLSIISDVMPHVACILSLFILKPENFSQFDATKIQDRTAVIHFEIEGLVIDLDLSQEAPTRSRKIAVLLSNTSQKCTLDFTDESNPIFSNSHSSAIYDNTNEIKSRPLESMLNSVLNSTMLGVIDSRLTYATEIISKNITKMY